MPVTDQMTDQARAEKSAAAMWANDAASQGVGMVLGPVAPGRAELTLTVAARHLNGHKICHGGFIFTLADSAFAFACNSYNQLAVAHVSSITHIAPSYEGEHLTARATEVSRTGRNGIYDVTVSNQKDGVVAEFRGHSRTVKGQHFIE